MNNRVLNYPKSELRRSPLHSLQLPLAAWFAIGLARDRHKRM